MIGEDDCWVACNDSGCLVVEEGGEAEQLARTRAMDELAFRRARSPTPRGTAGTAANAVGSAAHPAK
eukprot:15299340-Alexandrium_andersonii.AAC.1